MVTSLFKHERIRTTGAKAKELRRWADHLITLAKRGDLHARRQALAIVREKQVVHKLFEEANEKFGHSAGGYTRIVKLGRRAGDAAPMSLIELVVVESGGKKKTKKKSAKRGAAKKTTADAKDVKKPAEKTDLATEAKQKAKTRKKGTATAKEDKSTSQKTARKKSETKSKTAAKTKSAAAAKEKATGDKPKVTSKKKADRDGDKS
jgi:large subunit ribosomal protein L17